MPALQLSRRGFLRGLSAIGGAMLLAQRATAAQATTPPPNIVFILIDDLGWADLGCYGSRFYQTPQIDALAAQGMRFTDAYAACPVCSPTRACFLTGQYPARLNLTDWIPGHNRSDVRLLVPQFNQQLPLDCTTIAEMLKPAGYVSASIGKWHLGTEQFYPDKQGFDVTFGPSHKGQPKSYFYPYTTPAVPDGAKGEYLTDRLTDQAIKFIQANRQRPFFLYLSHYAVHTPLQAKPDKVARYRALAKPDAAQNNAAYAAMIESVDESVGRIIATLDELKLSQNTLVVFTSDNGGLAKVTSNAPLRAGKGTLYEGGIREPLIVRWPGVVKAGSTCDVPVTTADFYPTFAQAAAADPGKQPIDGADLLPLLKGGAPPQRDAIYWHYPHYHPGGATPGGATPGGAIRAGDWKLIEFFEDNRAELYNLKQDPSETKDLAATDPDRARLLRSKLADWRKTVNARMPSPNPNAR